MTVSTDIGLARWRRVADAIEEAIRAGRHPRGSRLPSEAELAERFGVHRHTVRRALAHLASEGRVRAARGSGTFVTQAPILYPITARTRFTEIVEGGERRARGRLLRERREAAGEAMARRLGVATGTGLLVFETLREADGRPVSLATHWMEAARAEGAIAAFQETGSLSEAFARLGHAGYRRARTEITAASADARVARRLGIGEGAPVLVSRATDLGEDARPLQALDTVFRADAVAFLVETGEPGEIGEHQALSSERHRSVTGTSYG